ncbi:uncharacterized protein B0H18DRAFT_1025709 [Fomitopsis serialis]|uniref:uncharacterized protein n=1 Tax=Fomitopsis serialis TaxID=139415 RepID=UPI00200738E7|nr:uncharacterized protein B0H18DRAFT_1025709 [Neoantrodia serialis]KAH9920059.1 hypothetical protein B0H18DRAFT_1025709 [Neoantrodia serialis]
MKQCSHTWVVMPITRAIDDKNAKDLTNAAFRMQLLNGSYEDGRITLIATKTDDISPSEVLGGSNLDDDETGLKDIVETEGKLRKELSGIETDLSLNKKRRRSVRCSEIASKKARTDTAEHRTTEHHEIRQDSDATTSVPQPGHGEEGGGSKCTSALPSSEIDAEVTQADEQIRNHIKRVELQKAIHELVIKKRVLCAQMRSRESVNVMKRKFVKQLKDLEDTAAEENDPDNYDPGVPSRDYSRINPPVLSCSAVDYLRIQAHVVGDGLPNTFFDAESTGIPTIQEWCRNLGNVRRRVACLGLLERLDALAESIHSYAQDINLEDVAKSDREVMRKRWQSDSTSGTGLACKLKEELHEVAQNRCLKLQDRISGSMERRCREAALKVRQQSGTISVFSYFLSALRRHGSWRQDLNVNLTVPFMRKIAVHWSNTFNTQSVDLMEDVAGIVGKALTEVVESATPLLNDLARDRAEQGKKELENILDEIVDIVHEVISDEQKEASRCLAPHIMRVLKPGYEDAAQQTGRGSTARRKALFNEYVATHKNSAFHDGANVLLTRLGGVTDAVRDTLEEEFDVLSEKMEVAMSVLWDRPTSDDSLELKACVHATATMAEIRDQIRLWRRAANPVN